MREHEQASPTGSVGELSDRWPTIRRSRYLPDPGEPTFPRSVSGIDIFRFSEPEDCSDNPSKDDDFAELCEKARTGRRPSWAIRVFWNGHRYQLADRDSWRAWKTRRLSRLAKEIPEDCVEVVASPGAPAPARRRPDVVTADCLVDEVGPDPRRTRAATRDCDTYHATAAQAPQLEQPADNEAIDDSIFDLPSIAADDDGAEASHRPPTERPSSPGVTAKHAKTIEVRSPLWKAPARVAVRPTKRRKKRCAATPQQGLDLADVAQPEPLR